MSGGNFIRVLAGSTLSAEKILDANLQFIVVCPAEPGGAAERTVIELPAVRQFRADLTIFGAGGGAGFRIHPHGDERLVGDIDKRLAVRLVPLLASDGPDAWGAM